MPSLRALIICSPPATEAAGRVFRRSMDRCLAAAGIEHEVHETRGGENLAAVVQRPAGGDWDVIVAAGGDGTVSAVGDSLLGGPIPLGIIPAGTGNMIARELGIPDDLEAAVSLIAGAHRARTIDAMRIGGRIYLLNASVGISASVIGGTTRKNKSRFGSIAYFATALRKMFSSRPRRLIVEVDGVAHPYRAVDVTIMNCGLLGKLLHPGGPEIRIDDGHLGVWILSLRGIWDYPRYAIGVATGWNVIPKAHFLRAAHSVRIRSRDPLPVQADGDMIGSTPIHAEVLPGVLTVWCP